MIEGIEGYIPYSKGDSYSAVLVLWKVVKTSDPFLGVKILEFIKKDERINLLFSCGINKKTIGIYQYLGYTVDKLKHYYRINDKKNYQIALINEKNILPIDYSMSKLELISSFYEFEKLFNFEMHNNRKPYKDMWYIKQRYFEHPIYKYKIYYIGEKGCKFNSILVAREITKDETKILRIVDFIGSDDELSQISFQIQNLIENNGYEYIDFYCYDISEEIMEKAGFKLRDENDQNIIPNYFEPFVRENVDIHFFTSDIDSFYLFKGDGDQDRPNFW